jgi:hypothetical protein
MIDRMTTGRDFTRLPEPVRLDDTVAGVDSAPVQAPEGDRDNDRWDALHAGG